MKAFFNFQNIKEFEAFAKKMEKRLKRNISGLYLDKVSTEIADISFTDLFRSYYKTKEDDNIDYIKIEHFPDENAAFFEVKVNKKVRIGDFLYTNENKMVKDILNKVVGK